MDIERLIPRTWDYLWLHLTEMWVWANDNPERGILLVVASLVFLSALYGAYRVHQVTRQQLLRGSKMPRKSRKKWVRKHTLNKWIASTERDISLGVLSEGEGTAMIRMLKRIFSPEETLGLGAIKRGIQDDPKLPAKERLARLKKRLQYRTSFYARRFLYSPVKIPGPSVPAAQKKALDRPKAKRGEFLPRKLKTQIS